MTGNPRPGVRTARRHRQAAVPHREAGAAGSCAPADPIRGGSPSGARRAAGAGRARRRERGTGQRRLGDGRSVPPAPRTGAGSRARSGDAGSDHRTAGTAQGARCRVIRSRSYGSCAIASRPVPHRRPRTRSTGAAGASIRRRGSGSSSTRSRSVLPRLLHPDGGRAVAVPGDAVRGAEEEREDGDGRTGGAVRGARVEPSGTPRS